MTKVGLATFSLTYSTVSRDDIRTFFLECLNQIEKLDEKVTTVLKSKGIYVRPPYISPPPPENIEFVSSLKFLSGGFFGFAPKRPLIAVEIAHLFMNAQTNGLGKALLLDLSQVAQSKELRKYLVRGVEISTKHVSIFSKSLEDENLPVPMTWGTDVTNSTDKTFSDKLMLFQISLLVAAGFGNYGVAAAASPRKDIAAEYIRLAGEIGQYAGDGAKMMIQNGWLEEPPHAPDQNELSKV